jgi:hypothetical protein
MSKQDSGLVLTTVRGNADEQSDMDIARHVAACLNRHYPGHPFVVDVQGRGIILRHMEISILAGAYLRRQGFGFLMPRDKMGTPKEIEASAVRAGGAMLELFKLPRGQWTGALPQIPDDWKRGQQRGFG